MVGTIRVVISTLLAPGCYVVACFYNDDGHFSMTMPFIRIGRKLSRRQRRKKDGMTKSGSPMTEKSGPAPLEKQQEKAAPAGTNRGTSKTQHQRTQSSSSASSASSVSSLDSEASEESKPKRSIRIKAINEDALRKRRQRRADGAQDTTAPGSQAQIALDAIKSPTSTTSHVLKYPRAPAPPRPLIPKRQPSYTMPGPPSSNSGKKTLIIDLDETLIHSMAKGGRMSTGHMVEVKLQNPVGAGGAVMGPQVPILCYVHKRPHCDEFLKKVSRRPLAVVDKRTHVTNALQR